MQDLKFIIAKNIQKLRQEKGMTQLELAEKLNYSDKTVSKWERGESLPDIVVLKSVADIFQVTLDYLVEEEHDGKPVTREMMDRNYRRNCYIITGTSIFIVALMATLIFVILAMIFPGTRYPWLCYAYAVPSALIVWLVFNSIWFNRLFREFGYSDCYDFFFLADELMDESGDFESLNNAKLLNYIGLYFTDEKKEHGFAKLKFEESKHLFEELNATNDEMYPIVVKNIEYVKDLIMDELISEMAKSILDETQED